MFLCIEKNISLDFKFTFEIVVKSFFTIKKIQNSNYNIKYSNEYIPLFKMVLVISRLRFFLSFFVSFFLSFF